MIEPVAGIPVVKVEPSALVAPLDSRGRSLTERLVAMLACSPETESGLRQLRQLLATASGIVLAFAVVSFFQIRWIPLPLRIFYVTLSLVAVCASRFIGFSRWWRWWAMGFCLPIVASFTAISVLKDADAQLGIVLLLLTLVTALIVPWGGRWQVILALVSMSAFAASDIADGVIDANDIFRWILLLVTIAFGVSFSALKDYAHRQGILTEESRSRAETLQTENSHRIRAEARLQAEVVQRKAAETLAKNASQAKSEFLSSMSHEIRTPMNAVLGMADLLNETELSGEQRRYLDVMVANGNSLLELINSILDLARIESGRMQIEQIDFNLTELIDKTISTFGITAHSKGLELIARIAPGVPEYLVGDPMRLRQILINFLGNAIKFTEAGEVILKVERNSESNQQADLRFTVSDTGIGIPPDKLGSIFSSFSQVDSSTTRKYGGTGLGLAIAQRLVALMDGRIGLESEIGKGSKFSFTLSFSLAPRIISPKTAVVLSLAGYRVLVVDDSQINRLILREMTAGCGATVSEADSGAAALAEMRQAKQTGKPYDIVLLDMRMPGMDGLEVARHIREQQLTLTPFILMLSSDDMKPQLTRLEELGLDAYLVKPITRKELFAAIHRLLEHAQRHSVDLLPAPVAAAVVPTQAFTGRPKRILVAEDSPDNRFLIGAYLRHELCQVDFAEDGEQAVAQFLAHDDYAMIFMDIQMPRMDGLSATRRIRELEAEHGRRPLPIIALTASALEEDVEAALAAGCNLHLSKPIKKIVLLDTIRNAASLKTADSAFAQAVEDPTSEQPGFRRPEPTS
jgi:two-component system, sensor histidine kinase and response regulator